MSETEIKKEVYKQQPKANFKFIRMGVAYYDFDVVIKEQGRIGFTCEIPVSDMGDTDFKSVEEAKLLLRWLNEKSTIF